MRSTSNSLERGKLGEQLVSEALARLPSSYRTFNDLILPVRKGADETTQIDHIVTCEFGCFVIETKKFEGTILGREHDRHWFQNLGSQRFGFANPLRQNSHHVTVLHRHLGLPFEVCHSIVVFVGLAKLLPSLPRNVITTIAVGVPDLRRYIDSFVQPLLTPTQLMAVNHKLTQLKQMGLTLDDHLRSLRSRDLQRRLGRMIQWEQKMSCRANVKVNRQGNLN